MKKYEELTIELVLLNVSDVISMSFGNDDLDNDGNTPEFPEFVS